MNQQDPVWIYARKLAGRACAWYTLLSVLLLIPALLAEDTDGQVVYPSRFLLLLPLALCWAAAGLVRCATWAPGARIPTHILLTIGGAYLFAFLPYALRREPAPTVTLFFFLLCAMVWGIGFAVYAARGRHKRRRAQDAAPYQSQFGKRDRDGK